MFWQYLFLAIHCHFKQFWKQLKLIVLHIRSWNMQFCDFEGGIPNTRLPKCHYFSLELFSILSFVFGRTSILSMRHADHGWTPERYKLAINITTSVINLLMSNLHQMKKKEKHRTRTPPCLWPLTLRCDLAQGQESMSLFALYLCTRYDVFGCNTLRHMTICLFFETFHLNLWHSASEKVTCNLTIRCTLCRYMLVPSMKFVGSIEIEIKTILV